MVAPFDQLYIPLATGVDDKVIISPAQTRFSPLFEIMGISIGLKVTKIEFEDAAHPAVSDTITLYTPACVTKMLAVVSPLDHW